MAAISGHPADFFLKPNRGFGDAAGSSLLLPARSAQRRIGALVPAVVSPERGEYPRTFSAGSLVGAQSSLSRSRASRRPERRRSGCAWSWRIARCISDILTQLDELTGALEKHMLHNDAWHFWQLGVYAERSLMTIQTLKQVLAPEVDGGVDDRSGQQHESRSAAANAGRAVRLSQSLSRAAGGGAGGAAAACRTRNFRARRSSVSRACAAR